MVVYRQVGVMVGLYLTVMCTIRNVAASAVRMATTGPSRTACPAASITVTGAVTVVASALAVRKSTTMDREAPTATVSITADPIATMQASHCGAHSAPIGEGTAMTRGTHKLR